MAEFSLDQWLAHIAANHPQPIDMGLQRVRAVAVQMGLGRPAGQVVTVAGTNGKGSTAAFIEAIARAAGLRVGTYTSPHLLAYNERVRIDGVDAEDAALARAFARVEQARMEAGEGSGRPPVLLTYFEFGTLAALSLFEQAGLDLAVLEVGLGGRLDAVNLIDPDVAVITTVDLDHQQWLGQDRERIGLEKAGIARAWKPLVLGEDDPPSSVLRRAYAIGASAIRAGADFLFQPLDAKRWHWREPGFALTLPRPAKLTAPVQLRNAAAAIAALRASSLQIPRAAYAAGVRRAAAPGRLQRFECDGVQVWVDVGHNRQAAQVLAQALRVSPASGVTGAVYAALVDKDACAVAQALAGQVERWWLAGTQAAGARGQDAQALAARLQEAGLAVVDCFQSVEVALTAALAASRPGDRLLVFGSFHAAASALRLLRPTASGAVPVEAVARV